MMNWFPEWMENQDFRALVVHDHFVQPNGEAISTAKLTVGIAVFA